MNKLWILALLVLYYISLVSSKQNGHRNESSKKSKPKEEHSTPSNNNTDSKVFSHDAVKRLLEQYKKYDRIRMRSSGGKVDSMKLIEEIRKRRNMPRVDKKIVLPAMKLNYTVGDSNWTQKNYIGRRFSDSVLEKPILTDGNIANTDNNSSLLNYEGENSTQTLLMQPQSSTPGTTFEVDTETSSSQTQTTGILSWEPTQESSSITTIEDDKVHSSIGNDIDKKNVSQVESHINNLVLVSTSTDSSTLNLETSDSDVNKNSVNEKTNESGLENASTIMNITLNGTLFNKSNDDNVTRVTNKTAILSDGLANTPLPKAPLQDLSTTEKNMKSDGKIEFSNTTLFNEPIVDRSSDKTEMNKQKVLANETNLNTDKNHAKLNVGVDNNDVSKPESKKVDAGDIKNRYGNFDGSSLNISKSVYRELDKSLLEPATKVMNSTDMLQKTSNSSNEVLVTSELGLPVQSLTEPIHNSLLKSTPNEPKQVNDQIDVTSSFNVIGSGLNKSLRHSPVDQSKTPQQNDTVHNRCLTFQKPVDTSEEIKNPLQDSSAHNHVFGNKRNFRNPTHTNSLNAITGEKKVSTDFESIKMLSSVNESNPKHVFTGMNQLPFDSMKFPANVYPIQVIHPSTIFKQTLTKKLYTFYRGKLYLLVPVPRYGRTTLKNDGIRLTNSNERLQQLEGGLPGQYNNKLTEEKNSIYPFTDQNLLKRINLDQPNNRAYYGIYDEFQQSQHQIYEKPSSHNSHENLNNRVDPYDENLQRNTYARTQQRQRPLFVNTNEMNMDHTSSPLQIDRDNIFPDRNTNYPSLQQSYFSQKPSKYEQIMQSPNYIQPSLISSLQKQSLYSNNENPYVASINSLTKESNTNHQPYHSFDSTKKQQISSPDLISFLLSLYKQSHGEGKSVGIFNTAIHPKQELFSYPQESKVRVTANDPISTQFPMNFKTTFEGQLRNNDILSNPLIPENYQLYINEPIKVSNRGQVPTVYSRIPRLSTNKVNNRDKLARNYYDTERNYNLQPTSNLPHVISRNENLPSNQNAPISAPTNSPYIINYSQNTGKEPSQDTNSKHFINSVEDQLAQDTVSPLPNKLVNDNLLGTITSELNQIIDQISTLENHPEALYGRDFSQSQTYVSHAQDVQTFETSDQHFNHPFPYQQTANRISVEKKQPETFHQPSENLILLEESQSNENSNIKNSRRPVKNHQPFHNVMLNDDSQLYGKSNVENSGRPTKIHHSFKSLILNEESQPYETSNIENSRRPKQIYQPFEDSILKEGSQTYQTSNSEQQIKAHQPFEKYILTEGSQSDENSNVGNIGQPIKSNQPFENYISNEGLQNYENSNIENNRRSFNLHQELENSILNDGSQPYENSKVENSGRLFSPYQQLKMSILNEGSQPYENSNVENSRRAVKTNQPFENFILNEGSPTYETSNVENSRRPFNPSQQVEKSILNEESQPYENSNVESSRRTAETNQPFENLYLNEESHTNGKSNIEYGRRPINLYQPFGKSILNEGAQLYENSLSMHNTELHSDPSYSSGSAHIDPFEPLAHRQEFPTSSFLTHLNNGYYQKTSTGRQYLPMQNGYHSTSGAQYSAANTAEPNNSPHIDINNKSPSISFDQNQHQTPIYTVPEENLYSYQIPKFVSPYLNTDPNTQNSFDRSQRLQSTYGYWQTNKMPSFPGASHIKRKNDVNSGGTTKTLLENSETNVRSIDWKKYKRPGKKATNLNRNLDRTFSPVSSQELKTTQTKAEFENLDPLISDPNVSKPPSTIFHTKESVRSDHTSGKLTNTDKGIFTANEFTNEQLMSPGKNEIPNRDVVNNNNMYNPQQDQRFTGSIDSFNPISGRELGSRIPSDRYNNYGRHHENLNRFQSLDISNSQNPLYNSDNTPESSSKYIKGYNIQPKFVSQHHHVSEKSRVEAQYGQPFSYSTFSKLNIPTQINHNDYNKPLRRDLQNLNIESNVPQNVHRVHNNHFRKTNTPIHINTNDNNRQLMSRDDGLNGINVPSSTGFQFPQTMQSDGHFTYTNQPNSKRPFHLENPRNSRRHYHNSFNSQSQTFHLPQPTWQNGDKGFSIDNSPRERHVNQFHQQPVSEINFLNGFGKDFFERVPHTDREASSRYTSQMNKHSADNTGYLESQQNNINNPIELNQPASQYSLKPTYSFNAERSPIETNHFHNGFEINDPQSVIGSSYNGNKEKYISYSGSNIQNQPLVLQNGRSQRSQRYHATNHLGSSQFEHRNGYYTNIINHNKPINVQKYPLSYYQEINHRQSMSHTSPDTRHISSNLTLDFDHANKNTLYKRTHQLNSLESNVNGLHSARSESYNRYANDKYMNSPSSHTLQPPASNFGKTIDKSILSNSFSSQTSNADGILNGYRLYPKPVNVHYPFSEIHPSLVGKGNNMNDNINTRFQTNPIFNPALNSPFPEPSSSDNGNIDNGHTNNGFQSNPSQNNVNSVLNSPFPEIQSPSDDEGNRNNDNNHSDNTNNNNNNNDNNNYNNNNNGNNGNSNGNNNNYEFQFNPSQNNVNPASNSPSPGVQSASGDKGNHINGYINNGFQLNHSQNNVNRGSNSPFPEIQSASGFKGNNMDDNLNNGFQSNPSQNNVNSVLNFPFLEIQSRSGDEDNRNNDNNHSDDGNNNNNNNDNNNNNNDINGNSNGNNNNYEFQFNPSQNNVNPASNSPSPGVQSASGDKSNHINGYINNGFQLNHSQNNVNRGSNSPFPEIQSASGGKVTNMDDKINNVHKLVPSQNNINPALNSPFPVIYPASGGEGNNVNVNFRNEFNPHSRPLNVSPALNSPYPEIQPASGDKGNIDNTDNGFYLYSSQNNDNLALNSPLSEIQPTLGFEGNNNIDTNNGFWNVNKSLEQYTSMNKSNGVADEVDELSEDLSKIFQKRIARLNKLSERFSAPIVINDFSQNRITSRNGALLGLQNKTKNSKAENGPGQSEKYDKDSQILNENLNSSHALQTNINSSAESTSVKQEGCLVNGTLMEVGEEWTVIGVCGVYTCQSSGVRVLDTKCPKLKLMDGQLCEIEKADNDLEFPLCCPSLKCKPKKETPKNSTGQNAS